MKTQTVTKIIISKMMTQRTTLPIVIPKSKRVKTNQLIFQSRQGNTTKSKEALSSITGMGTRGITPSKATKQLSAKGETCSSLSVMLMMLP